MTKARGLLAILSLSFISVTAAGAELPPSIRVVASASVSMKPDQAELELGVTTDKKTATAAVNENEKKMEQVMAAMKKEVGTDGEVKTAQLSLQPRFQESRDGTPQKIAGYTVTNTIHVRTTNTKAVGKLLDLAFASGANTVDRVQFTLKDPEAAQNAALKQASAKARARATAMAEGQGLRAGDVLMVSEGEREFPMGVPMEGLAREEKAFAGRVAGNVQVEPGSIEVWGTVTVVFALKAR
jgi:uncharacterized protein YggE